MKLKITSILLCSIIYLACKKKESKELPSIVEEHEIIDEEKKGDPTFILIDYDITNLQIDNSYYDAENRGLLENKLIEEASGIAISRSNPSRMWVHNDSGDPNRLFVIGENAEDYGYFWITGTSARDWEDICIGPGPIDGINYLYVGDIGDNNAQYPFIVINRFPEPNISGLDTAGINRIEQSTDRIILVYPDGPRDAETLMVDPWTKDLYFVTKRESRSSIYKANYPQSTDTIITLDKIAELPFNRALAGDISSDGTKIAIKTDRRIYCWDRTSGESVLDALKRKPALLPYLVEPQGEAFGWMPDGSGYYTVSEKSGVVESPLYYYKKK